MPGYQGKIGVFDSGLGGLTVFKALRAALPEAHLVYLGDTARTPYGSKGAATILRYSRECADFLLRQRVEALVVACNTSSAIALEDLRSRTAVPVFGTIDAAVSEALRCATKSVGIIATQATVHKGAYQERLKAAAPEMDIYAKACPLFVPLVENGILNGSIVDATMEHYLHDLSQHKVEALILGCTHYPFLLPALRQFVPPTVALIDCASVLANEVSSALNPAYQKTATNCSGRLGLSEYFVTDEPSRFDFLARSFFEGQQPSAVQVQELTAA